MSGNSLLHKWTGRKDHGSGPAFDPVIVVGAHRSGTTLITECLEQAGLFAGANQDPNKESLYFLRLNEWVLSQAGSRWDTPEPFSTALGHPVLKEKILDQLTRMMDVQSIEEYLGKKPVTNSHGLFDLSTPWGWKDPRNTLTLPLWLSIFPRARVIHVYRHGVDVAASLVARTNQVMNKWAQKKKLFPTDMITDSARCLTLDGAFSLWEHYLHIARSHTLYAAERVRHVQYEQFLREPLQELEGLAAFCGLASPAEPLTHIVRSIQADRAYAYRNDPELVRFAESKHAELKINGYSA